MKEIFAKLCIAAAAGLAATAWGQGAGTWNVPPEPDHGIVRTELDSEWRVSIQYTHRLREIRAGGMEWTITGESYDGAIAFDWGWGSFAGFGGGTQAHLEGRGFEDLDMEPGGGASLRLNLWELEPARPASWDVLVALDGRGEWRSTSDDREKLEWTEFGASLPVAWRLFFETPRQTRHTDFHSLVLYAGPAGDTLQGRRKLGGQRTNFHATDSFGAVAGVDLWLLERLRLGARLEYFGEATWSLAAEYAF